MSRKAPPKFKKPANFAPNSNTHQINLLRKAVMDTLRYRQIFDCPMSYFQIWHYLIGGKSTVNGNLDTELNFLVSEKKIFLNDGYYSLTRTGPDQTEKKRKRAGKLMIKAKRITDYLRKIPWIDLIAITGSVAAFNAEENCDIDILIITKPKRLFLSRFFAVLILKSLGVYWNPKKPSGTICPNIYLTDDNMTWNKTGQNLFTANEVALLYPLFSRDNCYFNFVKDNEWASHYLPNLHIPEHRSRKKLASVYTKTLLDMLEIALRKFQRSLMKDKITTEVVTDNFVHFNLHDASAEVIRKFQRA